MKRGSYSWMIIMLSFFVRQKSTPDNLISLFFFIFLGLKDLYSMLFCFKWISLKTLYSSFKRAFFINTSGFAASVSDMMNGQKKPSSLVRIFDCTHYLEKVKSS